MIDKHNGGQAGRQAYIEGRETGREEYRDRKGREVDRQTERQKDVFTGRETYSQIDRLNTGR